jgi:hypothetical protein
MTLAWWPFVFEETLINRRPSTSLHEACPELVEGLGTNGKQFAARVHGRSS